MRQPSQFGLINQPVIEITGLDETSKEVEVISMMTPLIELLSHEMISTHPS